MGALKSIIINLQMKPLTFTNGRYKVKPLRRLHGLVDSTRGEYCPTESKAIVVRLLWTESTVHGGNIVR